MTTKLRFALVGTGAFGAQLGRYILADPLGAITCICDQNPGSARNAAREVGIEVPLITDYEAVNAGCARRGRV